MTDLRDKIPTLAFIEAQVIHQAVAEGALARSVGLVEEKYNLARGSLGGGVFLESRLVALLYCLILVPREIWASNSEHPVYRAISETWRVPEGAVSCHRKGFWERPTYQFIHHLRNAVAHANFSFEGQRFSFWDRLPGEVKASFHASIAIADLQAFLETVGALLANLRTDAAAQQAAAADGASRRS